MTRNLTTLLALLACTLLLAACGPKGPSVSIDGMTWSVEVADEASEREQGLMGRTLDEGQGMLFVYDADRKLAFWMKDTIIPLDIIFINQEGIVVDIQTMTPCTDKDCVIYASKAPATYALEVNAGDAADVKVGDTAKIVVELR